MEKAIQNDVFAWSAVFMSYIYKALRLQEGGVFFLREP